MVAFVWIWNNTQQTWFRCVMMRLIIVFEERRFNLFTILLEGEQICKRGGHSVGKARWRTACTFVQHLTAGLATLAHVTYFVSLCLLLLFFSSLTLIALQHKKRQLKSDFPPVSYSIKPLWDTLRELCTEDYILKLSWKGKDTHFLDKLMCCNGREHVTDIALYFTTPYRNIWGSSALPTCWQSDQAGWTHD